MSLRNKPFLTHLAAFAAPFVLAFGFALVVGKAPVTPTKDVLEAAAPNKATKEVKKVKTKALSLSGLRTIKLEGPIDMGRDGVSGEDVANQILNLEKVSNDPIYLVINSPGGSVLGGNRVVTAMEDSKAPVYTICSGICASMAFIIHQYGKERYMTNRSILMSHYAAGGLEGDLERMNSELQMFLKYLDRTDLFVAGRAKMSLLEYKVAQANQIWIDSDDAALKNFSDATVSVKYTDSIQAAPSAPFESVGRKNFQKDFDLYFIYEKNTGSTLRYHRAQPEVKEAERTK